MTTVYLVQATHWNVPGCPLTAHSTLAGAETEALALTNIMLKDAGRARASLKTWRAKVDKLAEEYDDCAVWITETEVKG